MRKRTHARELALQFLYQLDITKTPADEELKNFWQERREPEEIERFTNELIEGVVEHLGEIDELLKKHAQNWELKRMAVIDRNIMRLSCFELLFREDIPPKVSLNEAVELAKKYGDIESSKFVNGILDKIHKTVHGSE